MSSQKCSPVKLLRELNGQMVKHITYIVMLPHTAEDSHTNLHTMTTVYINGTAYTF